MTEKLPATFIALDSGILCGFVTAVYGLIPGAFPDSFWLITLFVKEKYRRMGIATNLLSFTENELKGKGIPQLFLWTETKELTQFYLKRKWIFKKEFSDDKGKVDILSKQL